MRSRFACLLLAGMLTLAGCSDAPEAPAGAMEGFAKRHAAGEAGDKAARIEAARAREAVRAADARQKIQAAAGIERFEQAEKALDAPGGDKAARVAAEGFTSAGATPK